MSSNQISFSSPSGLMDRLKSSAQRFTAPLILATTITAPNALNAQDEIKLVSNKATANEVRVDGRSTTELASRVRATTSEVYENRLQEIIDRATNVGLLKSKEDFSTTLIQSGKAVYTPNEKAYNEYISNLKSRTREAFPDSPENLSAILSTIYRAKNGVTETGFKGEGIRTDQIDKLLNHSDLRESYKAVRFITTGILNNVNSNELINGIDEILARELLASK